VLVTGATGFLGRPTCTALAAAGYRVRGLVRGDGRGLPGNVEQARVNDLLDREGLAAVMVGVEAVVHLAARVHVDFEGTGDPYLEYRRVNVEGTRAVLDAALAAGVRRVVVASSVKAVGSQSATPMTELTEPNPVDPYGRSKLEAERLALDMSSGTALGVTILRLPLVYGPGVRANALRLLQLVDRGVPLPFGRIRNRRSFAFVDNVTGAIAAVLGAAAAAGEVFFMSDGVDLSTPELIRLVARSLGRPARLLPIPTGWLRGAARAGDLLARWIPGPLTSAAVDRLLGSLVVDVSKLRRVTGFSPPVTPEAGWAATAQWYRQQGVGR
jgi:nucleoside-diphosphate-sugar epimerase